MIKSYKILLFYLEAINSISTFAPNGNLDTSTVDLAGNSILPKKLLKDSLTMSNWFKSMRNTANLTMLFLFKSASFKIESIFLSQI